MEQSEGAIVRKKDVYLFVKGNMKFGDFLRDTMNQVRRLSRLLFVKLKKSRTRYSNTAVYWVCDIHS